MQNILIGLLLTALFIGPQLSVAQHYSEPDSVQISAVRAGASNEEWDIWVNEVGAVNNETVTDDFGEYDDWVEIYNFGDDPVDLHLAYVTDDPADPMKFQLIATLPGDLVIEPGGFLLLWADEQPEQGSTHLDFSLDGSGEYFGISEPNDAITIDGIAYTQQLSDVTYGRIPDGGQWNFFTSPTPGAINDTPGLFEIVSRPTYSVNAPFFSGSISVVIEVDDPGASIRYTTDGSEPTLSSTLYTSPLVLSSTTMLRARAFKVASIPSRIATNTYIADEDAFDLDIVSLVTDSANMWGATGIYDNRYSGIEKPVHIEYFSNTGELQFEIDGGVKIHAPDNRPQQSLRLYARSDYGDTRIEYPIFEDKDIDWYKRLVLRNAANDGQQIGRTHFRDCMCHELFSEMSSDNIYAACKPVNVFLNGQYWGIYNLRERQDEHFIKANYGFEDVDFLERTAEESDTRSAIAGDWENYDAMRDYLMENDMADPDHYGMIEDWIDIRNYVDYMATEIWTGNRDWLTNNIKYYRPRNIPEAKWKWVLWDTEYGMGCYPSNDHGNPNFDALHMSMSWGGWPPYWGTETSTYMMHNLRQNPGFVDYFITRHADLLNFYFNPEKIEDRINDFVGRYNTDMPRQVDRWAYSMGVWDGAVETLTDWATARPAFCREHVMNKWDHVTAEHLITLDVVPEGAGYIEVNTIYTDELPWDGFYFEGVPVQLKAIAHEGYQFAEWLGTEDTEVDLTVWLESDSTLTALFEENNSVPPQIVINEINYNSAPFLDTGDWVELTNAGQSPVALGGWEFRDGNDANIFTFPEGTTLDPDEFLMLSTTPSSYFPYYPNMQNVMGPLSFGFSNQGELLRLYNASAVLMDFVEYGVDSPWPVSPNGSGTTLELIAPNLDNTLPGNWFARDEFGGSPGAINDFVTSVQQNERHRLIAYPNPSKGFFTLQAEQNTMLQEIEVFNAMGSLIKSENPAGQVVEIDLSSQPRGMYLLRVSLEGYTQTLRLLKQ